MLFHRDAEVSVSISDSFANTAGIVDVKFFNGCTYKLYCSRITANLTVWLWSDTDELLGDFVGVHSGDLPTAVFDAANHAIFGGRISDDANECDDENCGCH